MTTINDHATEIFHFGASIIDTVYRAGGNVPEVLRRMRANDNTIAIGLVTFLLHHGYTPDQVRQAFLAKVDA